MINLKSMDEEMFKKKHRVMNNFFVNPSNNNSYNITTISGKALNHCSSMTESLINYLEKAACIKITELVIDFIIDESKVAWMHEVKSIKSSNCGSIWHLAGKQ